MTRPKEIRIGDGAIVIPAEALQWHFVRSSGPGGQHVNRTSSKAVLRFAARHGDWCNASRPDSPSTGTSLSPANGTANSPRTLQTVWQSSPPLSNGRASLQTCESGPKNRVLLWPNASTENGFGPTPSGCEAGRRRGEKAGQKLAIISS